MQSIFCMNAQRSVRHVLRSVKNILIWSIVRDAQRCAGPVQKLVIQEWQLNPVIIKIKYENKYEIGNDNNYFSNLFYKL